VSLRLSYADCDGIGIINPATEILEENNYYPFGLKHQGYNELPGDGYKYKFLNKEYEDSFALNVTETDFRHYDSALARFNVIDKLSELAPNYTPYRYGFNNPVVFSDPSGLFETEAQAKAFALDNDLGNYKLEYNRELRGYTLTIIGGEFDGTMFYDFGELLPDLIIGRDGDGSGGGGGLGSESIQWTGLVNDIKWTNGILGGISTRNVYTSGYLKYNNLWHKTKTRGYSFATQNKWNNSRAKYWREQQIKSFQSGRNIGKALTKIGSGLVVADVLMSGQMKPSHYINGGMLAASGTGVGSIVAGIWFVADM